MKIRTTARLAFALTAFAAVMEGGSAMAGSNLLVNGGFETGDFTGWTVDLADVGSNLTVGTSAYAGQWAALFAASGGQFDTISQTIATVPGQQYLIEMWIMNLGVENDGLLVQFGDTVLWNDEVSSELETYVYWSFVGTADEAFTQLTIGGFDGNAAFYLDEVSVTAVPAPGAIAALALAGLHMPRRRKA